MARGASRPLPHSASGPCAMTSKASSLSAEDKARIATLLLAAGRAHDARNLERLKAILLEILEIDPDHVQANYNLGILYRDQNDTFQAEIHLRRTIRLDPKMSDAYQGLA